MAKRAKPKKKEKKRGIRRDQLKRKSFVAVRDSVLDIGKKFSEGADKVADILLDEKIKEKNRRGEKIKKETVSMFKEMYSRIKRNLSGITIRDVLCDVSYNTGRAAKITKDSFTEIFRDIME